MAIKRVEIEDFLVFRGEFAADFCPGVNVLIGENGTGKTTLLKLLYFLCCSTLETKIALNVMKYLSANNPRMVLKAGESKSMHDYFWKKLRVTLDTGVAIVADNNAQPVITKDAGSIHSVYIPEKDILSNARGLPETYKHGNAEFTLCEIELIEKARVLADCPERPLYREICELIGGEPVNDGESFFMKRNTVENPIPFIMEASGYRKLGLLATLIRNEQVKEGTVLFWDEPENSLNPELVPALVNILLTLSRNGVQVFVATHSEILASYFAVNRRREDDVLFCSLFKNGESINVDSSDRFDLLQPNSLTDGIVKLYEREIERGLGGNG